MKTEPDVVAQGYNPSTGDAQDRRTGMSFELTWVTQIEELARVLS